MVLYALAIFLSAFLLFLVQPIVAKEILPWFGGSAAVWATCLVFFQSALLAGYAYADWSARHLRPRTGAWLHATLLVASIAVLPIIPAAHWKPLGDENPIALILGLLAVTIGLPYFLLTTTSPLLQAWFARRFPARSPYRLFALSNLASMLALLGYPFVIEPNLPTRTQALAWSVAYSVFALLCAGVALLSARGLPATNLVGDAMRGRTARVPVPSQLRWVLLAATGSILLLAVTNHITQNIAAVPLLWLLPLTLYLVTFIVCFDNPRWYVRRLFLVLAPAMIAWMAWTLADTRVTHDLRLQIAVFCGGLFVVCMFCHGELAREAPEPAALTRFYLMIALGGALGAALVGVAAPLWLPADFELGFGLVLAALVVVSQAWHGARVLAFAGVAALVVAVGGSWHGIRDFYASTIYSTRNFYGVLRVQENGTDVTRRRQLVHGTILHGNQYLAPDLVREPSTYYTQTSGIGRVLEMLNPSTTPLKVGMIGLGAGTIAAYGAKGDEFRIYDINPAVIAIANTYFSYLHDSDAHIVTPLGDARLSLEREPPQNFDVLAIDAFSSDAIPVHLITSEAVAAYLRHMKPGGIIAFHVTNRFLDLVPVVQAIGAAHGLSALWISDDGEAGLASRSDWVLLARDPAILARPELAQFSTPIVAHPEWRLWTDDFNNLVQVLKRP
ncbi:MAG: fused MFS/spermidine synthase [Proteobacteria bacterium]|nr:fused MFS/spermidine synthase [Pseudomonadota bacterium]